MDFKPTDIVQHDGLAWLQDGEREFDRTTEELPRLHAFDKLSENHQAMVLSLHWTAETWTSNDNTAAVAW